MSLLKTKEYIDAKKDIQGFFDGDITMYILPDIDRLAEIRPDDKGLRGCTVPLAMMLFSIIDLFGFLMREDKDKEPKKTETFKNFEYLFSTKYFPQIYSDNLEKIVKLFRHKITHQFFPGASGISKAGIKKPLIYDIKYGIKTIPILNVDILARDVIEAIYQIKEDILKESNAELIIRMYKRRSSLINEDYDELDKL